jgi:hypothetical protein
VSRSTTAAHVVGQSRMPGAAGRCPRLVLPAPATRGRPPFGSAALHRQCQRASSAPSGRARLGTSFSEKPLDVTARSRLPDRARGVLGLPGGPDSARWFTSPLGNSIMVASGATLWWTEPTANRLGYITPGSPRSTAPGLGARTRSCQLRPLRVADKRERGRPDRGRSGWRAVFHGAGRQREQAPRQRRRIEEWLSGIGLPLAKVGSG